MSNKYGSIVRTYFARNMYEVALNPPDPIPIASAGSVGGWVALQIFSIPAGEISPDTNFLIRQVGLLSNFADGLVFASVPDRIDAQVVVAAVKVDSVVTGQLQFASGDKTVVSPGGVFGTQLIAGSIVKVVSGNGTYYYLIDSVTDANNAELTDYPKIAGTLDSYKMATVSSDNLPRYINIPTLNSLYDVNEYLVPVARLSSIAGVEDFVFLARVNTTHDIMFSTIGINTDYENLVCTFDLAMTLEFTSANPDLS